MKALIVFYSGKGSNRYLAKRMSKELGCDAIELKPKASGLIIPATLTGISFGNKALNVDLTSFDKVVLCGPLYMGKIASPCVDFIKRNLTNLKSLNIATCCCSTDEKKDDKFGYGGVFAKLRERYGNIIKNCEAFPIALVLPDDLKNDDQANMNTRLNDENFNGEIETRLNTFISQLK